MTILPKCVTWHLLMLSRYYYINLSSKDITLGVKCLKLLNMKLSKTIRIAIIHVFMHAKKEEISDEISGLFCKKGLKKEMLRVAPNTKRVLLNYLTKHTILKET